MRNKKGVTMIELVLVIIIILIIATFSVLSGRETFNQATATEVYTEISAIREAVNGVNIKRDLDEKFELTSGDYYDVKASELNQVEAEFEAEYGFEVENGEFENLYIIYGMDELEKYNESKVKNTYGFDSIKHTYIINFNKVEVDLLENLTISDKTVRTYEEIRALVDNGEI